MPKNKSSAKKERFTKNSGKFGDGGFGGLGSVDLGKVFPRSGSSNAEIPAGPFDSVHFDPISLRSGATSPDTESLDASISLGGPISPFPNIPSGALSDPGEISKKDIVEILKKQGYDIELCVEENKKNKDAYIYTFEAVSPDGKLVIVRVVEAGDSLNINTLKKYIYSPRTYKKPNGKTYTAKWSRSDKYSEINLKEFSNKLYYITMPIPNDSVRDSYLPFAQRDSVAERYLTKNGYTELKKLGEGNYGVVYSCKNKDKKLIAAKVVISGYKETVDGEINASKKVSGMKPLDTKRLMEKFNKHGAGKIEFNTGLKKRDVVFREHINVPVIKHFSDDEDYYIAVLEAPLMDKSLEGFDFPKSEGEDKINHKEMKAIISSVLRSLQLLHKRNIVHLDVKPENVLAKKLGDQIIYALTDFGVSRDCEYHKDPKKTEIQNLYDEIKLLGEKISGTKHYMAPEVYQLLKAGDFRNLINDAEELVKKKLSEKSPTIPLSDEEKRLLESALQKLRSIGPKSDVYSLGVSLVTIVRSKYLPDFLKRETLKPSSEEDVSGDIAKYIESHRGSLTPDDILCLEFISKLTISELRLRPDDMEALRDPYLTA